MARSPKVPAAEIRVGISGWTYTPWRGVFFPPDLPQNQELHYASRQVRSIEINGTFYSLQRPSSFLQWYGQTPADFVFSVKGPRFITHIRRLKNIELPLANFFASGVLRLNEKLGPLLWQFPAHFHFDAARFESFFTLLPRDTRTAATLARRHDHHLKFGAWTEIDRNRPIRHAVEIRHPSFAVPEFIALLRQHNVALVVADTAGKWPLLEDVTADFVYVRLHGDAELYISGYTPEALQRWAAKLSAWREGRDASDAKLHARPAKKQRGGRSVYVYFDNDVKTHAPFDAMALAYRLGLTSSPAPKPFGEIAPKHAAAATPRTRWPGYGSRGAAKVSPPPSNAAPKIPRRSNREKSKRAP